MTHIPAESEHVKARLLVVSNRLPVTIKKAEASRDGDQGGTKPTPDWTYIVSSGGLVSALSGVKKQMSFLWIGWPGFEIEDATARQKLSKELLEQHSCMPVFLSERIADLHYNGFSNSTIWPLFHYLPGGIEFDEAHWDAHYRANVAFATAIREVARGGDMIWVHDYHLMLLPALLRETLADLPNVKIGFFLHIPFPSSEVYRVLPVRKQVLWGLLQCDLIGFHTYDYARHFLSSCARILGLSTLPNGVEYDGRFVHVGAFPIGIDPEKFIGALEDSEVKGKITDLQQRLVGKKLMVGIDRLDYIKGVPHKLYAFDMFLTKYPEFVGKVVLLQVAVPTRTEVEEYKDLRTLVNELVGRINSKFGTFDYTPVQYLYRSITFADLVALYYVADVCVVTSTRDGMNLVSYEYIATQKDKRGVLILSEFAGAAQSMNGAIIINPWNMEEILESYREALLTPPDTAAVNHEKLFKYVLKHTASFWGQSFLAELQRIGSDSTKSKTYAKIPTGELQGSFKAKAGFGRLVLLELDEALKLLPESKVFNEIDRLSHLPKTFVYVLTGGTRAEWKDRFGHGNVGLVCEFGCFIRHPLSVRIHQGSPSDSSSSIPLSSSPLDDHLQRSHSGLVASSDEDWIQLAEHSDESWQDRVRPLLHFYTDHTPGARLEEREKVMVWHFTETEREFGMWQASELQASLEKMVGHAPVSVLLSSSSLELRPSMVDQSVALRRILTDLGESAVGWVLAVKERKEDDGALSMLPTQLPNEDCCIFTVCIGKRPSNAKYYLDSANEVVQLLSHLQE